MELLKDKIKKEGRVTEDNILMVDSFLTLIVQLEKQIKSRYYLASIDGLAVSFPFLNP